MNSYNKQFDIGDVVKIKNVTEQDKLLGVTEGSFALISFCKGYDEYEVHNEYEGYDEYVVDVDKYIYIVDIVKETYNDISKRYEYEIIKADYYLNGSQLELYRERHITSILYACGVPSEIIESTRNELLDYITETYDVSDF